MITMTRSDVVLRVGVAGRPAATVLKREGLDLVVGEVIELAGGPRLVRRTSRQTPSADWTLSSMKMHLQSASAGHCCAVTAGGGTGRGRVISTAHLVPRVLPKAGPRRSPWTHGDHTLPQYASARSLWY